MWLRPPDKPTARELQRRCHDAAGAATVAAAGTSTISAALGEQANQFVVALAGLVAVAAMDLGRRAGQIADTRHVPTSAAAPMHRSAFLISLP
jgi:hypothetical protein